MTSAEKSIIPEFKISIERNESFKDFEITQSKITNKITGSFIIFSGIKTSSGDQTANLKSLAGITTWIIEEGEDFVDEKAFDKIDDSIRSAETQNRVIWIQNPSTKEHFIYNRWINGNSRQIDVKGYKVTVSNNKDVEHIHTTYHIAEKYLSDSFLNKAKLAEETNNEWYYHNYIGGWLEKAEGVIFNNWEEGVFDESLPYVWAMDFGYVEDPTSLIKVAKDKKKKKVYIKEYLYEKGLSTNQISERLKICGNELIVADNSEPRLIAELQALGHNVIACAKGPDSVRNGIASLSENSIIVDHESENAKKELNNYSWSSKKSNVPVDKYNHIIDALRYGHDEINKENNLYFY
jgi:phage terminase large subunit